MEEATQNEGQKAVLIGHSAGGWLARAVLSDGSWPPQGKNKIMTAFSLLSLSTSSSHDHGLLFMVNVCLIDPPPFLLGVSAMSQTDATEAKAVISNCITLGTPHFPPEPPVMDMTRGALTHVHVTYPGAYLKNKGIGYTTVVGNALTGVAIE